MAKIPVTIRIPGGGNFKTEVLPLESVGDLKTRFGESLEIVEEKISEIDLIYSGRRLEESESVRDLGFAKETNIVALLPMDLRARRDSSLSRVASADLTLRFRAISGKTTTLDVHRRTKFEEIARTAKTLLNIDDSRRVKLFYCGQEVPPSMTPLRLNIRRNDLLIVVPRSDDEVDSGAKDSQRVSVRVAFRNKTMTIHAAREEMLVDLKERIKNVFGVPVQRQRLRKDKKSLRDGQTVKSLAFKDEEVLTLSLKKISMKEMVPRKRDLVAACSCCGSPAAEQELRPFCGKCGSECVILQGLRVESIYGQNPWARLVHLPAYCLNCCEEVKAGFGFLCCGEDEAGSKCGSQRPSGRTLRFKYNPPAADKDAYDSLSSAIELYYEAACAGL